MTRAVALFAVLLASAPAAAQEDLTAPPSSGRPIGEPAPSTDPAPPAPSGGLADGLGDPRFGDDAARVPEREARADRTEAEEPWTGPAVELGYTHYNFFDGFEGGDVHAGTFGGFLPFGPIRIGGWAELGVRGYSLGDDDLLVRANVIAGYQYLGWLPFAPYAGATLTVGVAIGQRFGSPEAWGFGGGGVEAGAEMKLVKNLWLGLSIGYQRVSMAGSGFDLWVFRVRAGL